MATIIKTTETRFPHSCFPLCSLDLDMLFVLIWWVTFPPLASLWQKMLILRSCLDWRLIGKKAFFSKLCFFLWLLKRHRSQAVSNLNCCHLDLRENSILLTFHMAEKQLTELVGLMQAHK